MPVAVLLLFGLLILAGCEEKQSAPPPKPEPKPAVNEPAEPPALTLPKNDIPPPVVPVAKKSLETRGHLDWSNIAERLEEPPIAILSRQLELETRKLIDLQHALYAAQKGKEPVELTEAEEQRRKQVEYFSYLSPPVQERFQNSLKEAKEQLPAPYRESVSKDLDWSGELVTTRELYYKYKRYTDALDLLQLAHQIGILSQVITQDVELLEKEAYKEENDRQKYQARIDLEWMKLYIEYLGRYEELGNSLNREIQSAHQSLTEEQWLAAHRGAMPPVERWQNFLEQQKEPLDAAILAATLDSKQVGTDGDFALKGSGVVLVSAVIDGVTFYFHKDSAIFPFELTNVEMVLVEPGSETTPEEEE